MPSQLNMLRILTSVIVCAMMSQSSGLVCRIGFASNAIAPGSGIQCEPSCVFNTCEPSIKEPVCAATKGVFEHLGQEVKAEGYSCLEAKVCATQDCMEIVKNVSAEVVSIEGVECQPIKCCSNDKCNGMPYDEIVDESGTENKTDRPTTTPNTTLSNSTTPDSSSSATYYSFNCLLLFICLFFVTI